MNTYRAAVLWGVTEGNVCHWCRKGLIDGAKKIMKAGWSTPHWYIPDNAKRPALNKGRPTLAEKAMREQLDDPPECMDDMPEVGDTKPLDYVWDNQDRPIKKIADALHISSAKVVMLYDHAMKMYLA